MMSPQCPTCGAYYTGQETVCTRCGTPRASNPYQANPYQMNQNPYQAQQNQGVYGMGNVNAQQNWLQRAYSPDNMVKRIIIGRLIGWGIGIFVILACVGIFLFLGVLGALTGN